MTIQVRPIHSVDRTMKVLRKRTADRGYGELEYTTIETNILSPSYRSLNAYMVDSDENADACVSRFLDIWRHPGKLVLT